MALPDGVVRLLDRQHGVAARVQLLDIMAEDTVDTLVGRRAFVPVERGVYRVRGGALTARGAAMAALLRARPGARLTGAFVLGCLGLDGFDERDPFTVLTAPGRRMRGVRFDHRPDPTPSVRGAALDGLTVVTATAAIIDTAAMMPEARRVRVALDLALRRRLTTPGRLRTHAAALPRRHAGATWVRDMHRDGLLECESEEERRLGRVLRRIDPRPAPQGRVGSHRVDWLWPSLATGVEFVGSIDHDGRRHRLADAGRRAALAGDGVEVIEVHGDELAAPDRLARRIHALLAVRAVALGRSAPTLRPARPS